MIVISDIHLGRKDCMINEVVSFIRDNPTNLLILNGDIFDQFAKDGLMRIHFRRARETWKLLRKRKTKIIYLVGNHDYLAFLFMPFGFLLGIKIRKRVVIGNYLIEHGDWISFYLKMRCIKRDSYHNNCKMFALVKRKVVIVGHSHDPRTTMKVIDVGDWVEHGTYFDPDVAKVVKAFP